jgi:putative ABC transport system permease protein
MFDDLRYSLRALAKHPSFAITGVLVLGLAVGVNTAVFSLINALLLRPLPVRAPDELAFVYHSNERMSVSYSQYQDLQQESDVFTGLAARSGDAGRRRNGDDVVPLEGEAVSANYFDVLGVAPRVGRGFQSVEESLASTPVVVISEGLWKSQFAADPTILGRTLRLDAGSLSSTRYGTWTDYTIVGVMPATFTGTGNPWQPAQFWTLLVQRVAAYRAVSGEMERLRYWPVVPIGRLAPGVTLAQARASVDAAARNILQRSPEAMKPGDTFQLLASRRVRLPFSGAYFMDVPRISATLMAVATLLLIIAAANLAGMLMARGISRRREIAIRLSLGVGRVRLVRQLLLESLLLAIGGSVAGLAISRLLVTAALRELPRQLPGANAVMLTPSVPLDGRVVAFAFGTCLLTAFFVGMAPGVQAMKTDLLSSLTGSVVAPRQSGSWLRRAVLVPQIALSLVLLLVTGVFVRNLLGLELASPGYDAAQVVALDVELPQPQPGWNTDRLAVQQVGAATGEIHRRILDRVTALAGIESAALTFQRGNGIPLPMMGTTIIARSDYLTTNRYVGVTEGYASSGYFDTLGIRLLRGRVFDARERAGDGAKTTILSERLADELWPGKDPIGEWIGLHSPKSPYPPQWLEVVGVVRSVTLPLDEYPRPAFYVPIESYPLLASTILVRGAGNPAELIARVKHTIVQTERTAVVSRAGPIDQTIAAVRYPRRFSAALLGASGLAGLVLAALGVFGLMSYAVAQRVGEIGVRMVLGAQRKDVIRLVLFDGAGVVVAGIVIGFGFAFAAIRYASHAIVPLPDIDALTFIVVPTVLMAIVLLACYLPARRAASVDPLAVLRTS